MMFGLDASKKKKLNKVFKDKNTAATASATAAKSSTTTSLQRSASTRVTSSYGSSSTSTGASTGWQASAPLARGKVFEWIDEDGRSSSPPPLFRRNQVKELMVDLNRGSGLGLTLRGGSDHSLGIFVSSVDADSSAAHAGFRVGDQVLSLNGVQWVKYEDEEESEDPVIEPGIRLESAVQSILRSTQSSRTLRFRIRSTGKVPSASVIRSSASLNNRRTTATTATGNTVTGSGISSNQHQGQTSSGTSATEVASGGSGGPEGQRQSSSMFTESSSAFVRKKSLIPFSRCSFRSDSRNSSSSSTSATSSRQQQQQQQLLHHQPQAQQQQQHLNLAPSPDVVRRASSMEITPMPSPLSPTAIQSSRRPSFAHPHPYTAFDIELRKILTESEAGTFHYFRNEYLKGRLPVTSLVNFLKQFLDRIDHRHALIRLVYDQVIRPEEKDLFQRLVSASFSSTHIPTVTQYNPRRQSSFSGAMTGMSPQQQQQQSQISPHHHQHQQQQQLLSTVEASGGSIHCISSDDEELSSGIIMDNAAGGNSGSKRRLSTTSVTSMGNSNLNGSNANLSVISRNRRCSSLHLSNPGKRFLPGIPLTSSDLNLNPAAANPRRASIMSNASGSGHHLLPLPPHQQQQQQSSSSLAPPNVNSLALKRHSTSRIESSSLGLPVQDDIPRRHSSTVLGVNQASNMMPPSNHLTMIWNAAGNLEPESKRKYFSASANSMGSLDPGIALANASNASSVRSLLSGRSSLVPNATAGNQLLVPSVNVRRSSVDVDRNSSGDEADPDSRLQLPVVSQLRRGSGNHLMIPGEEDAPPSLYLVLPQVDSSSNQRRGSTFNQGTDQFGNDVSGIPFATCHTRVRRHRSLPSPFISGGSSALGGVPSVSPSALSRRSSAIQGPGGGNATQMPLTSGGQRISNMQFSGSMTAAAGGGTTASSSGSSRGLPGSSSGVNSKGQVVTMVQGYSSPQEQQMPQQHRRSSSFRRPLHRSTIEPGGRVRVHVKKCKPFLGIAIEGGSNVRAQPLPRIISILGNGAAFESGDLHVGHIILEVDCISTEGLRHDQVAQMIADAYYKTPHKDYIELLVREKKKAEFDVRHSSIILLNSKFE